MVVADYYPYPLRVIMADSTGALGETLDKPSISLTNAQEPPASDRFLISNYICATHAGA
jgi:hypothetical protein